MNWVGFWVLVAALAVATAFAVWRRRTDGRLRPPVRSTPERPAGESAGTTPTGAAATTPAATATGPSGHGASSATASSTTSDAAASGPRFPAAELGITLAPRATLVQFSTAFCQPCRATRRVLTEVAGLVDGVTAIDVDAEAHLDVVRQLNILRTPTVFVLDSTGAIAQRGSGQPRKADVIAAVGRLGALQTPASEV